MTPRELGYHFPAEWEKHEATWLTFPYLDDSFPGKLQEVYPYYFEFIRHISHSELVKINIPNHEQLPIFHGLMEKYHVDPSRVIPFLNPSNDVWCRDHGPSFVVNKEKKEKAIVNWGFNAWGGKYPAEDDNRIPERVAKHYNLKLFEPSVIMEGGSVEFNGAGTILTSRACLLNKNRNPQLNQIQIEKILCDYYGQQQVLWVGDGIAGDDTDGHIDDITRFINESTVVTVVEENKNDVNYQILQENLSELKNMRLLNGQPLNIIELPMPEPVYHENRRLPASYANFYYTNQAVIVPIFGCDQDDKALNILSMYIQDRDVIGIYSRDIVWGLGSFHCLSQQEPALKDTK